MSIRVFISNITGSNAMRKQQRDIMQTLEVKHIEFQCIDISDTKSEEEKLFMRKNSTPKQGNSVPLPPQVFNGEEYCGDYEKFAEALEDDKLHEFLKLATPKEISQTEEKQDNDE